MVHNNSSLPIQTLENNAKEVWDRFRRDDIVVDAFVGVNTPVRIIATEVYGINAFDERMNNDYDMREVMNSGYTLFFLLYRVPEGHYNTIIARSADLKPKENELWVKVQYGADFYPNLYQGG